MPANTRKSLFKKQLRRRLVTSYQSPAQLGFPGVATPLQITAGFPELGAAGCQAAEAARKTSPALQTFARLLSEAAN